MKLMMLNTKNVNVKVTQYGVKQEKNARGPYDILFDCHVQTVGVFISSFQPYLCARLDGVTLKNDRIFKTVEFKDPVKCKKYQSY